MGYHDPFRLASGSRGVLQVCHAVWILWRIRWHEALHPAHVQPAIEAETAVSNTQILNILWGRPLYEGSIPQEKRLSGYMNACAARQINRWLEILTLSLQECVVLFIKVPEGAGRVCSDSWRTAGSGPRWVLTQRMPAHAGTRRRAPGPNSPKPLQMSWQPLWRELPHLVCSPRAYWAWSAGSAAAASVTCQGRVGHCGCFPIKAFSIPVTFVACFTCSPQSSLCQLQDCAYTAARAQINARPLAVKHVARS